jgi:hypothetical protein
MTNLLLGAALAGLAFFAWSAISWMALPWHHAVYKRFVSEDAVARAIAENAPVSGIYGMPEQPKLPPNATKAEREAADKAAWDKMQRGPILTAIVWQGGFGSLPRMLAVALATAIVVALGFGLLLAQTHGLSYAERTLFVGGAGLLAALACRLPDWNWHKFPIEHALVNIADSGVGWTLAGLVLAHFVRGGQPAV